MLVSQVVRIQELEERYCLVMLIQSLSFQNEYMNFFSEINNSNTTTRINPYRQFLCSSFQHFCSELAHAGFFNNPV